MYLYFGLGINDLEDFCQLMDKEENEAYTVNDRVFINKRDGVFIRTFIAKLIHLTEENFVIIGFDDRSQALRSLDLITLKSFKDCNKEIRVKLFDAVSNVNIRDNFKYTVRNGSTKSEDDTKTNNKQTYYFTLTKDDYNRFVYNRYDGTKSIITAIWNDDHTNFTLENVLIEPVITVSTSSDLLTFRIVDFDSRNFHISRNSHNAYEKQIYFYERQYPKTVEFFTDLDDCIRFTKSKKENPKITNKLEEQCSWDCKPLNMSKKETKMIEIKDIKLNGPATILFITDDKKVVVKCRPGDNYDPEKGILMVLCKYIIKGALHCQNWTEIFDIPYSDEIDVEKVIAMSIVKGYFYKKDKDWHYNYVLKYMYNAVNLQTEDRVKALKALNYSVERISRCLGITKGEVKDILESKTILEKAKESLLSYLDDLKKSTNNKSKITITGTKDPYIESLLKEKPELKNNTNPYEVPDRNPDNKPKKQKDVVSDQDIIELFNKGYSISKISKELGLTEYFVKKYLDAYTNPKTEKKAARILKKATKEKIVHKKHVLRTEIDFPDYLEKEECEKILAATKLKYADNPRINCMSELQKFFIRECKIYKIKQLYGKNGYSMYEIAQIIGTTAAGVQKMYNAHKEEIES